MKIQLCFLIWSVGGVLCFFGNDVLAKSAITFGLKSRGSMMARPERSLSQVVVPKDGDACFSPEEPCDLKLIKLIQSAQKSIDIAIYDINRDQLVHELLVASKKVSVRVVVDRRQSKGNRSLVGILIQAGVPVRFGKQRGIMHDKFTIVDSKIIETGSFNYTNHASEANHENQVYLASPNIVEKYNKQFETLWLNAQPAR
jgi:phosphatidylserine/phosphatidylglycerophosphate/cardiolipin synthase-like enzyme